MTSPRPLQIQRKPADLSIGLALLLLALLASAAMPAAAQFSGGSGDAVLMQLNVESSEVDGAFLRNGRPFPADFLDSGNVHLESKLGDPVLLGNTFNGTYGPLRIVSGLYEPQFSSIFAPLTAPRGDRVPFSSPIDIESDQSLTLDVPAVRVSLSFLLNGGAFPTSSGEIADFYLRDPQTGREVHIGTSQQAFNRIYVVPGVYDVIYAYRSGIFIPPNPRTIILEQILIDQGMSLEVDVPMVLRTVTCMLNGVPFPTSGLDYGWIYLEDVTTNTFFYAASTNSTALLRTIPGTYRVIYSFRESQAVSPTNRWKVVDDDLLIEAGGSSSIQISVTAHTVEPSFTMDGLTFPGSGLAYAQIQYEEDDGELVTIGRTHLPAGPVTLIEGSYDFYYRLWEPNAAIPANPETRFAADVMLDASGPFPLDVETAVLDLDLLLDGSPFPSSGLDYGRILLVEPESGAELELGRSNEGPMNARVVAGQYNIVYSYQESQALTPINSGHVVDRDLQITGATSRTIDIRTRLIAPRFTLDGVAFPDVVSDHGQFILRDEDGDSVWLGDSDEDASDKRIIEGAYHVDYEWQSGSAVPVNPREMVAEVFVPEPGFAAGLISAILLLTLLKSLEWTDRLQNPSRPSRAE
ncbi:MAG: hypothetical protein AB8G23_22070 [Myxococcota bacterium]